VQFARAMDEVERQIVSWERDAKNIPKHHYSWSGDNHRVGDAIQKLEFALRRLKQIHRA
jgi:hypothetical protein